MPDSPYVANPSVAGQELAHVLPSSQVDPLNLVLYYQQKKDADKLQAAKDAAAKKAHMEAMQKYFGGLLNPKDYETQTGLDTKINEMGVAGNQEVIKAIGDSKGEMSWADVNALAQQKLKPILDLYQKGTAGKAYIDTLAKSHEMDKDVDLGKLKAAAMHNMIYKRDPNTGAWSLDPDGIDGTKDYVTAEYFAHPEWYTKGNGDININAVAKNDIVHTVEGTTKVPVGKYYEEHSYKGGLNSWEELRRSPIKADTKGKQTGGDVIGYQTIAKPNALSNGMVMPGVSDNTYAQFTQDMSDVGKLRLATQEYMKKDPDKIFHDRDGNMVQIDPTSDDFKTIEKKVLYDKLNDLSAKKWSTSKIFSSQPNIRVTNNNGSKQPEPLYTQRDIDELIKQAEPSPMAGWNKLSISGSDLEGFAQQYGKDKLQPTYVLHNPTTNKFMSVFYKVDELGQPDYNEPIAQMAQTYNRSAFTNHLLKTSGISAKQKNIEHVDATSRDSYSNVTEGADGTIIGYKGGRWYNVKTGKPWSK